MNKNVAIIGGIIAVLVISGIIFYSPEKSLSPTDISYTKPTDTTLGTTNTSTTVTTTTTVRTATSIPIAATDQNVDPAGTTAVVTGTVTPNGAFTNYWYEYGATENLENKTSNQTVGSGYVSIPAPGYITGLSNKTKYYFRLVAENSVGKAAGALYSFQTTGNNPAPVGSAPDAKTLSSNGISRTSANLRGEVSPNRGLTQYWFEYGTTNNLGDTSSFVPAGSGNGTLPAAATVTKLAPATTYYFRINAQNQFGTVNGSILNFKTDGPAITSPSVTTGNASDIGVSSAILNGTVNANGADTTYWFEYSSDTLVSSVLLSATEQVSVGAGTGVVSVNADITNLKPRTTHYFSLHAQNSLGIVKGSQVTFKTK
ncbi:MAG: hypothetical protein Q7S86_01415 [bacterium]|nr:hypothetical protein [bacterium]